MNQEQKSHLLDIQQSFIKEHKDKFEKGALEHKTQLHKDFSETELLSFAIEEVLDLVSYLYTLRAGLRENIAYCEENGLPVCKNCGLA